MARRSAPAKGTDMAIRIIVIMMHSSNDTAMLLLMPLSSFAPKNWLVLTENPDVSPQTRPSIRNVIEEVHPTPDIASAETVLPTIIVSAIL